ncbi:hypothetical protein EDC18_1143 [Natranaerovirga pectinivora]|uniref:DUF4190 domain-containing protein n=1 Tax=Natranaerovirga pectinivora TaxID=682400 RepID=A0A4R3ME92_9FIRM|nr:hypothetical protein [Natranaerovirga pectinivora]TCT12104.1 hypothetical protein EDC18_1143 [Natranaerovirga pectinivora]
MYEHDGKYVVMTIFFGIMGLVLWLLPLIGVCISLLCIILSIKSLNRKSTIIMKGSLVLGVVGFFLSFINSILIYVMN